MARIVPMPSTVLLADSTDNLWENLPIHHDAGLEYQSPFPFRGVVVGVMLSGPFYVLLGVVLFLYLTR